MSRIPGYNTEKYVGEVVRESGIPREEIWVTTKLPYVPVRALSLSVLTLLEQAAPHVARGCFS